jgi:hypothetical protein
MTRDEIVQMAQKAAAQHGHEIKETNEIVETLTSFAELVAAKEREACAKVCDKEMEYAEKWGIGLQVLTADKIATAIRARSV